MVALFTTTYLIGNGPVLFMDDALLKVNSIICSPEPGYQRYHGALGDQFLREIPAKNKVYSTI